MFQHEVQQVHFAVVRNGYDRRQVDAHVAEYERRASEARARLEEAERSLAETTRRARALEAKLSAMEHRSPGSEAPAARPVAELAERLLETVSEAGQELPAQILSEAERDRARIERLAADVEEVARFRAARIVGSARRDRREADELAAEARRQIDEYIDEARSIAEEREQAVWDRVHARLRQPMLEVDEARRQGRAMRRELRQLQDMRDEYWQRVVSRPERLPLEPAEEVG